ncbi:hypothetical protein K505DRAFT_39040 [Melanomma pulvis-pyrius CBS 109.77]|uniref:Secreted protein n=1 Tax=Melanomma pulvis-pyrius CBS 109.77 TaxID=1314802 RepID=A0A6A6XAB5_9PLEO|nr:hypothetical protein K505DRAFT_39040 [Melanomma pulvis-pyrius CBS 109.77]
MLGTRSPRTKLQVWIWSIWAVMIPAPVSARLSLCFTTLAATVPRKSVTASTGSVLEQSHRDMVTSLPPPRGSPVGRRIFEYHVKYPAEWAASPVCCRVGPELPKNGRTSESLPGALDVASRSSTARRIG